MKHIFISYAREDRDFARLITSRLRESGKLPWQDIRNIRYGDHWQTAIDEALRNAEALVVIMSPQATKSQYVTYEWAFALGAGIRVIPVVRKRTELHPRLRIIHYIDFTTRRGTPWVNLRKALPAGPSTIALGPEVWAKFNLIGGKPVKQRGYYALDVYIRKAPKTARQVTYEFHDETLKPGKWTTKAAAAKFEYTIQSNGDSLITATIRMPGKKLMRLETPLYEALVRGHGPNPGRAIKQALNNIRDSRS